MGNSPGGLKGFAKDVGEAVIKPVGDEFQKAVEAGVSSVIGTGQMVQDPKKIEEQKKKKEEEQKKITNIKQYLQQLQAQEQRYKQQKIEENQKKQQGTQEEQDKKQVKQFEVAKKRQAMTEVAIKQRQVEIKRGGF